MKPFKVNITKLDGKPSSTTINYAIAVRYSDAYRIFHGKPFEGCGRDEVARIIQDFVNNMDKDEFCHFDKVLIEFALIDLIAKWGI